jgi:peptidoglycan hydrolase-like protein with peptidoglycan-binding domain
VAHRATVLLPELWAYGAGTRKTENTDGRWITYVASPMPEGRRGVVAFRPRPNVVPTYGPPQVDEMGPHVRTSAETHEPGSRTLRDGYQGDDVFYLQGRLGVRPLTGTYDAATIAAVRAFQRSHPPLAEDGVTGPKTWRELLPAAEA